VVKPVVVPPVPPNGLKLEKANQYTKNNIATIPIAAKAIFLFRDLFVLGIFKSLFIFNF
jgi:hypothetical protein